MKKKQYIMIITLIIFSLCILIATFVNGCSSETNKASANSEEIIERVRTNDYRDYVYYSIFRDKETGQEYIVFRNIDGGIAVTPRLPQDMEWE
jgi:PBP1b-binding outer membrane lipoprotein LpoB